MTTALILAGLVALLVGGLIAALWGQSYDQGKDTQRIRQMKEKDREKQAQIDALKAHPLTVDEQRRTLQRLRDKLRNRRP